MDVEQFLKLKQAFQRQSFIVISHSNKDGDYRGDGRWRNVVDVIINSENGRILQVLIKTVGEGVMKCSSLTMNLNMLLKMKQNDKK